MRVGVIHDWKSNWYTGKKEFPQYLLEDVKIRDHIYRKLAHAGLSDILIRKDEQRITVDIYTARPGIVIGKAGSEVDALRKELHDITDKAVQVDLTEIIRRELDARVVAESLAEQLQDPVAFGRAHERARRSAVGPARAAGGARRARVRPSRRPHARRRATRRRPRAPPSRGLPRSRPSRRRGVSRSAPAEANQVPQGAPRAPRRPVQGPHERSVRRVRPEGTRG